MGGEAGIMHITAHQQLQIGLSVPTCTRAPPPDPPLSGKSSLASWRSCIVAADPCSTMILGQRDLAHMRPAWAGRDTCLAEQPGMSAGITVVEDGCRGGLSRLQ